MKITKLYLIVNIIISNLEKLYKIYLKIIDLDKLDKWQKRIDRILQKNKI